MIMRSKDGLFSPDFSILVLLTLEGWMVMLNLIFPPWNSITENNLNNLMAGFSDSNKKLCSLEKLYPLPDFYSSTWRHCQIVIKSDLSLHPRWHISSRCFTTTEICCLYRRRHSWNILLSRDDWISNNIDHFRLVISSFSPFVIHQKWYIISPASYWTYQQ